MKLCSPYIYLKWKRITKSRIFSPSCEYIVLSFSYERIVHNKTFRLTGKLFGSLKDFFLNFYDNNFWFPVNFRISCKTKFCWDNSYFLFWQQNRVLLTLTIVWRSQIEKATPSFKRRYHITTLSIGEVVVSA